MINCADVDQTASVGCLIWVGLIALDKALFSTKKYLFFLFLGKNICCGYSVQAPRQGASNEYPQHMFSSRNKKTIYPIPALI